MEQYFRYVFSWTSKCDLVHDHKKITVMLAKFSYFYSLPYKTSCPVHSDLGARKHGTCKTPIVNGSVKLAPRSNALCISGRIRYGDHYNLVQPFCLLNRKCKHRKFVILFLGFPGVLFYEKAILRVNPEVVTSQVNEVKFWLYWRKRQFLSWHLRSQDKIIPSLLKLKYSL